MPPDQVPPTPARQLEALLPDLLRVACYLTRDRDAAEDLVQETLLSVWARMAAEPAESILDLRSYTFASLRNRIRSRTSRPILTEPAVEDLASPAPPPRLACAAALRAMDALPPDQAAILRLFAVEGLAYAEIAARLNLPMGTVTSRISRARRRLCQALDLPDDTAVSDLLGQE